MLVGPQSILDTHLFQDSLWGLRWNCYSWTKSYFYVACSTCHLNPQTISQGHACVDDDSAKLVLVDLVRVVACYCILRNPWNVK